MGKVISFGYTRRSQPPQADRIIDVRSMGHNMDDPQVDVLVNNLVTDYTDGQTLAIGCEKGKHRSVEIAKRIADKLRLRLQHRDLK